MRSRFTLFTPEEPPAEPPPPPAPPLVPPYQPGKIQLQLMTGAFFLNGVFAGLLGLALLVPSHAPAPQVGPAQVGAILLTSAANLQTAFLLRARRRRGALLAAFSYALTLASELLLHEHRTAPIVIGLFGLLLVVSVWKYLE